MSVPIISNGMKVLMLSTDRSAFDPSSAFAARLKAYGEYAELLVIVFSRRGYSPVSYNGRVFVYPTNSLHSIFYGLDALRLARNLPTSGLSLVTAQDPFETGLIGYFLSRNLSLPLEIQVHTDFFSPLFAQHSFLNRLRVFLAPWILKKASGIRVVRPTLKENIVARYGVSGNKISVLPVFFSVPDIQKKKSSSTSVLVVARLEKEKGVDLAISGFSELIRRGKDAMLFVAGEGKEKESLRRLAESLDLGHRVSFLGKVLDMGSVYGGADILLSTSLYEGYGLSIMEAAASGIPIVSTRAGVAGDVLGREDIFLINERTANSVADSLEEVIEEQNSSSSRALKAKKKALTAALTLPAYAEKVISLWRRASSI